MKGDDDVGRLGISANWVQPALVDDVRRAIAASADLEALARLQRRGWVVETDGRSTTGKRGPAFSAKK
jgi:hypothetical protein